MVRKKPCQTESLTYLPRLHTHKTESTKGPIRQVTTDPDPVLDVSEAQGRPSRLTRRVEPGSRFSGASLFPAHRPLLQEQDPYMRNNWKERIYPSLPIVGQNIVCSIRG